MTTEATATDTTATTTDDAADDAALMEGFTAIAGEPNPAAQDDAPATAAADAFADEIEGDSSTPEQPQGAAEQATQAAAQAALGGMSDDEINTLRKRLGLESLDSLKQGLDSLAGRVGGINRTLQQIQSISRDAPQGSAAAAAAAKFNRLMLKELAEFKTLEAEYPDLAQHIAPVFDKVLEAAANAAAPNTTPNDVLMEQLRARDERLAQLEARDLARETRDLNHTHPNWQQTIGATRVGDAIQYGADFTRFIESKGGQPFKQQFETSIDAEFVSSVLSEFKQFASGAPSPAPAPAPAPAAAARSKQQRLAAAAVPTGQPAPVGATTQPSEEDDMEAGFKAVRSGRL